MKFTCTKTHLVRGLVIAEKVSGRNISLPILENILLKTESPNKLNIMSTDLELGISVWIPAKIEEEGESTLPIKIASSLIQNLPEGNIEGRTQKETLIIKAGQITSKINGEEASLFPRFPSIKKENPITLPVKEFTASLSAVSGSASFQETKPELMGVFISFSPQEIVFAATDTFRLAEYKITPATSGSSEPFFSSGSFNIILPLKTTQEIIRIFQQEESKTPLICYINEGQILFTYTPKVDSNIPEVHIVSRVIEGEYPDYHQIIPKSSTTSVVINKQDFQKALKSSGLFTNRLREVSIDIFPSEKKCVVKTYNQDKGEYVATLACEGEGEDVSVVMNHQYIVDGISNITEGDVRIRLEGSLKPVLISSSSNKEPYLYVVMPIRKDDS